MSSWTPSPLLINADKTEHRLERVPLGDTATYTENWLQDLLYRHPQCLPAAELDHIYDVIVPLCREMSTDAGPIDVVYATPSGRLVIVEAKLWRNPEARRKVIAQILDYAKELSAWDYEELDKQFRRARRRELGGQEPPSLFEVVRAVKPDLDEARFVDSVARYLQRGEFLLLIVGDGIREGAGALAEFLEGHGTLHFTFGLVEVAIYRTSADALLVQPRVVSRTEIVRRFVVQLPDGRALRESDAAAVDSDLEVDDPTLAAERDKYQSFWKEFLDTLSLDDQSQPISAPARTTNQYFRLPATSTASICAYVAQSSGEAGVYLTFSKGAIGDRIYAALLAERVAIDADLGVPVDWHVSQGKGWVVAKQAYSGLILKDQRRDAQTFMRDRVNRFVNVFRGRIERLANAD